MSEKKCRETGELILSGRSDKRFIDDKARSKHHNLKNKEKNQKNSQKTHQISRFNPKTAINIRFCTDAL